MCGFVVIASLDGGAPVPAQLEQATALLAHRGPDDTGQVIAGGVGIGFRRLSVFDLSPAGHQPMESADGRYVIAFNGAIYNFAELRVELEALGHVFRSRGDTEVLLAAYRQWGRDCLPRLNGMWAFIVHDRQARRLFGARDRFGVKPLFWHANASQLVIASEIKALRDAGLVPADVDRNTLAAYLFEDLLDCDDHTFYAGVRRVPAGTCFDADLRTGNLSWHRWWSLDAAVAGTELPADPPAAFAALFEDAIRLRLRSDVPVGVLLSGGLDSTSIACSMARQRGEGAHPLAALAYMDPAFDESPFIASTVDQTGAALMPLDITPMDVWDTTARMIWHQDEPAHGSNAVVGFHLLKLARAHGIEVVLNGQGADETLAGYPSSVLPYLADLLRAGRLGALHRSLRAFDAPADTYWRLLQAGLGSALRHVPGYAALARRRRRDRQARASWVSGDLVPHWQPHEAPPHALTPTLRHSLEHAHLPVYLRVEDRNSMAHGIEERLPFLDHRLVSLAFRLSSDWKLREGSTKVVLREAMRARIPEPVRARRQKYGFPVAIDNWVRGPLYAPLKDLLGSRQVRESGLWDLQRVHHVLEQHRAGAVNAGEPLFKVVQVCHWMQLLEGTSRAATDASARLPAMSAS